MINVCCRTNLDLWHAEEWPDWLPCRPVIGDRVLSLWTNAAGRKLELEVVAIRFDGTNVLQVELHLPSWFSAAYRPFDEWYKEFRTPQPPMHFVPATGESFVDLLERRSDEDER